MPKFSNVCDLLMLVCLLAIVYMEYQRPDFRDYQTVLEPGRCRHGVEALMLRSFAPGEDCHIDEPAPQPPEKL